MAATWRIRRLDNTAFALNRFYEKACELVLPRFEYLFERVDITVGNRVKVRRGRAEWLLV